MNYGEWKRYWTDRHFLGRKVTDPRDWVRLLYHQVGPASQALIRMSYISVEADVLMSLAEMRECDSMAIFHADEDGPTKPMLAHCRRGTGHDEEGHTNGYFSWSDDEAVAFTPEDLAAISAGQKQRRRAEPGVQGGDGEGR